MTSPEGNAVATIGEKEGLPPFDQGIILHPLGEGKVFAVGSFGPNNRAWLAIIESGKNGARVNIFHKATRVLTADDDKRAAEADLAFRPGWVLPGPPPARGSAATVYVGRGGGFTSVAMWERSLIVDLATLQVALADASFAGTWVQHPDGCLWHDGQLLVARGDGPVLLAAPGRTFEGGKVSKPIYRCQGSYSWQNRFLRWQGRVYAPGLPWLSIDPQTLAVEPLIAARPPHGLYRFAISAHYGPVAWGGGSFFRILINRPTADGTEGEKQTAAPPSNK